LEREKLCLLAMIGVRADGRTELVALTDGFRESHESWADLLRDCRRRGMRAPILAVGDGAQGFWKALREVFPQTKKQRCWFHKQAMSLLRFRSRRIRALAAMKEICNAEDADGDHRVRTRLWREVPEGRGEDRRRCRRAAGVLPYPAEHWIHLRTTNPIVIYFRDRAFEEQGHQGAGLEGGRARDGVQADRGR
jgi:putative transposase